MNELVDTRVGELDARRINRRAFASRTAALGLAAGVGSALSGASTAEAQDASPAAGGGAEGIVDSIHLLTAENSALLLVDHQPWVAQPVETIDRLRLINNVTGLAKSAAIYSVPTVLSTVYAELGRDPIFPEIQAVFPDQDPVDRIGTNAWDDPSFRAAVEAAGRRKLVIAALYTEICLAQTALSLLEAGYEVFIVEDASGGTSQSAHQMALQRLFQAGAIPMTWVAVISEWARGSGYDQDAFTRLMTEVTLSHGGESALAYRYAMAQMDGR